MTNVPCRLPGRVLVSRVIGCVLLAAPALAQTTWHVPGDVPTIQGAIDAAATGDTILIGPGLYPESLDTLGKSLVLTGTAGADFTVVDAAGLGQRALLVTGGDVQCEGLKLTNGAPPSGHRGGGLLASGGTVELTSCIVSKNTVNLVSGGGVYGDPDAFVRLEDCTILGNKAMSGVGGGVAGNVVLVDCTISGNEAGAGGGLHNIDGASGCSIHNNHATSRGGGVVALGTCPLTDCVIQLNHAPEGGGIWMTTSSDDPGLLPGVSDVTLLQNSAQRGGGLFYETDISLADLTAPVSRVVFADNVAFTEPQGDGAHVAVLGFWFSRAAVERCTFVNDGLEVQAFSGVTVSSSIFRGLAGAIDPGTAAQVSYSDVEGGFPGEGNIDADPLFADPLAYDFALLPGSPAINTGDPALPPDPDGSPADMGAIAFHPWTDLGFALAGTLGSPQLTGEGPLTPDSSNALRLSQAAPFVNPLLVVGFTALEAPFKGGVLLPFPHLIVPGWTGPAGESDVEFVWPPGIPSGVSLLFQAWLPDDGGPAGFAASNGLRGTTP